MKIGVDKNQFAGKHGASNRNKHRQMEELGAEIIPLPLPFGDYCLINDEVQDVIDKKGEKLAKKDLLGVVSLAIDTKKNIEEIWGNVHSKTHQRFQRELIKPLQNNSKMFLLIEHGEEIQRMEDVYFYYQPEQTRYRWVTKEVNGKQIKFRESYLQQAIRGDALYKSLCTIRDRYNVEFVFCNKNETGKKILEILSNDSR